MQTFLWLFEAPLLTALWMDVAYETPFQKLCECTGVGLKKQANILCFDHRGKNCIPSHSNPSEDAFCANKHREDFCQSLG